MMFLIKVLNDTKNLQFNFEQITSKKTESGKCIIVFPNKLVCYYDNKDKKELIINNRIMAITQKRYNKSFFYPLSKTNFINILSKNELINVIQKGDILINDYINITFIDYFLNLYDIHHKRTYLFSSFLANFIIFQILYYT